MKNIFKTTVLLAIGTALVASCDLDLVPNSAISYTEGAPIFVVASDVQQFQNGIYGYYRALEGGVNADNNTIVAKEVMCDGFNAAMGFGNRWGELHRCDDSFNASSYYPDALWGATYEAVKDYNIVIDGEATAAEDLKAKAATVAAEAHFFRAAAYLELARTFGKDYEPATANTDLCVPLVLHYNPNDMPERATTKQVYDAIKNDIDAAAAGLANVAGKKAASTVTIDAINALLARYYLDIHDYANAAQTAEALIAGGKYPLTETAEDLFAAYHNDSGEEAILKLYSSLTEKGVSRDAFATYGKTDKTPEGFCYYPTYIPSKKLVEAYEPADFRMLTWFDLDTLAINIEARYDIYSEIKVLTKYEGNPALANTGYPQGYNAIVPFHISEQYLIAAEANLNNNKATEAKAALNALQVARGATATEATAANIHNEWFKETVGEGLRLSCLKRWHEGFSTRSAQTGAQTNNLIMTGAAYDEKAMVATDFHFQWPVPKYEMQVNPNLVQNTGFAIE